MLLWRGLAAACKGVYLSTGMWAPTKPCSQEQPRGGGAEMLELTHGQKHGIWAEGWGGAKPEATPGCLTSLGCPGLDTSGFKN